jgi:hypothetical protein
MGERLLDNLAKVGVVQVALEGALGLGFGLVFALLSSGEINALPTLMALAAIARLLWTGKPLA